MQRRLDSLPIAMDACASTDLALQFYRPAEAHGVFGPGYTSLDLPYQPHP